MVLLVPRAAYLPVLRTLTLSIFFSFLFFLLSYTQLRLYAGTFRNVIVVEQLGGLWEGGGGVKKMKVIVRKERKKEK